MHHDVPMMLDEELAEEVGGDGGGRVVEVEVVVGWVRRWVSL